MCYLISFHDLCPRSQLKENQLMTGLAFIHCVSSGDWDPDSCHTAAADELSHEEVHNEHCTTCNIFIIDFLYTWHEDKLRQKQHDCGDLFTQRWSEVGSSKHAVYSLAKLHSCLQLWSILFWVQSLFAGRAIEWSQRTNYQNSHNVPPTVLEYKWTCIPVRGWVSDKWLRYGPLSSFHDHSVSVCYASAWETVVMIHTWLEGSHVFSLCEVTLGWLFHVNSYCNPANKCINDYH